jgi:hypothetical protein
MGQGVVPAMQSVATSAGCCVIHSQHLKSVEGKKLNFVNRSGSSRGVLVGKNHLESENRFAYCVREI